MNSASRCGRSLSSNDESSSTGAAETSRSRSCGSLGMFLRVATGGIVERNMKPGNCRLWTGHKCSHREMGFLLFLFLHFSSCRLCLLDDLLLQLGWYHVVMIHLHVEAAASLGHRSQVSAVGEHLRHGHLGFHYSVATFVVHALNATTAAVEIAHDCARKLVGHCDLDRHYWFQQSGLGLFHGFLEGDASRHLEGEVV